ncbi:N-acetylmuramoyl-L-alanine amidase [Streptomyces ipomoeae]|uniref:N-acetylmuramoyl-L-alanine amidase n=2 Tax=Streptomyces ipomoeae TaxID=103232 RepID=L1KZI0_9ACTN|nr:N-acetylmuramoyl-L-alanine amidase [Streptomyces ipomoeae]EKX65870.1 N-acetylmuramoyl-L-alanine amidase [Streptomyces ipomoeae 91-03]MDX2693817.1 N-acetylmuramoyl-L-alanine amidase [Streptomyces ipomoeae]MDX2839393.1 N-acetylmuramoyl-L-alanine amidase [Streptomyces ipomoeae]TQE36047.1 N-acetylmuramoyl-L-alanine amidase [Streptomyces ipomoeae]TQE39255.1 N-acetylmuramoyl-L-alanine amidase [Streptomyces ipomoeae]
MRGSPTDRRPTPHHRRARTTAVAAVLLLPLLGAAPPEARSEVGSASDRLQGAFADAAAEYGVPRSVLLGVSYLQSRWDAHGGAPSVTGGYGPMHLTDARTALAEAPHHSEGTEDARGDDSRAPLVPEADLPENSELPARLRTLTRAAELTGLSAETLRTDAEANVAGGAALLAAAQRELGEEPSADPADWYGAVARFSGADDRATAATYANEVFAVIRDGARRVTDAGQRVALAPEPGLKPDTAQLSRAGLRAAAVDGTECPRTVSCEWIPAPYEEFGDNDYGNHDLADRPKSQSIRYIVVHDTEATWDTTLKLVQDPTYVSWHYSLRSTDGHIAQHVKNKDVAWHAGNWYVNAKSIGLEHEGFLASPDAWYTEAMYRTSARLVRYLAAKYRIPLDRQHILGHDTVPGPTTATIPGMHTDPGPYWDWRHYFELLGRPFGATSGQNSSLVTILPDYAANRPEFTGCAPQGQPCAVHGSSAVRLYSAPDVTSPLIKDIGLRPDGGASTTGVNDLGSRVSTGQQYAVAERRGDWTAIWYLGQKAWFQNPKRQPTAVGAAGLVVTPKPGLAEIPVYGRAYPEAAAYPQGVPAQAVSPLPYKLLEGQRYVAGDRVPGEYYYAVTFDTTGHKVVIGEDLYYEIQFGHRVAFVRAADVRVLPAV